MDDSGATAVGTVYVDVKEVPAVADMESAGTGDIPQDGGEPRKPLSADGAVLEAVAKIDGLNAGAASLSADGIVRSAVNSISLLNGVDTRSAPVTQQTVWDIERALEHYGYKTAQQPAPEGLTGFSLRMDISGQEAAGTQRSEVVLSSLVRDRMLIVQLSSEAHDAGRQVQEYRIMQSDGRPLPDWLDRPGRGLLVGKYPVDLEHLGLRVVIVYTDGSTAERSVVIETMSGEIRAVPGEVAANDAPSFRDQLDALGGRFE